jgi:hypothetical protein
MSTLEDVTRVVAEINAQYPRPGLTLSLSEPYDLSNSFSSTYPNNGLPGVYLLFDHGMNVLRIGKASLGRTLGGRFNDYFRWGDKAKGQGIAKDPFYASVRFIVTVGLPIDRAFEAPAIEEFMLQRLDAPLNKHGTDR